MRRACKCVLRVCDQSLRMRRLRKSRWRRKLPLTRIRTGPSAAPTTSRRRRRRPSGTSIRSAYVLYWLWSAALVCVLSNGVEEEEEEEQQQQQEEAVPEAEPEPQPEANLEMEAELNLEAELQAAEAEPEEENLPEEERGSTPSITLTPPPQTPEPPKVRECVRVQVLVCALAWVSARVCWLMCVWWCAVLQVFSWALVTSKNLPPAGAGVSPLVVKAAGVQVQYRPSVVTSSSQMCSGVLSVFGPYSGSHTGLEVMTDWSFLDEPFLKAHLT